MVIQRNEISHFGEFLREQYQVEPLLRCGEDGELMRAVYDDRLLIVLEFNDRRADVWCNDEPWLSEMWTTWMAYRKLAGCAAGC